MNQINCYHTPTSIIKENTQEVRCEKCNELLMTLIKSDDKWLPVVSKYEKK